MLGPYQPTPAGGDRHGLAAILFMIGYVRFGVAMNRTVTLPRLSGLLVAVGARLICWVSG